MLCKLVMLINRIATSCILILTRIAHQILCWDGRRSEVVSHQCNLNLAVSFVTIKFHQGYNVKYFVWVQAEMKLSSRQ
jgi:hypothetical protein